jgi:hypothetical protein
MRRLALAVALACVLSGASRAGEIHSTGAVAPPTPSPTPAEIHTTDATETDDSTTVLTIILTFISIVS